MSNNLQVTWDEYARFHGSVTTSFQIEVYKEARKFLYGNVLDCGCGTGKLAPLLAGLEKIESYLGVDCSPEMIEVASHVIAQLDETSFSVSLSKIEAVKGCFDSAVSTQSFYDWPEPTVVLSSIFENLKPGGIFVLVTPNHQLDIDKLLAEAKKENICHPDFPTFEAQNKLIAGREINCISMQELIDLCKSVGFSAIECHQRLFLGGLCFVVLKKE